MSRRCGGVASPSARRARASRARAHSGYAAVPPPLRTAARHRASASRSSRRYGRACRSSASVTHRARGERVPRSASSSTRGRPPACPCARREDAPRTGARPRIEDRSARARRGGHAVDRAGMRSPHGEGREPPALRRFAGVQDIPRPPFWGGYLVVPDGRRVLAGPPRPAARPPALPARGARRRRGRGVAPGAPGALNPEPARRSVVARRPSRGGH